MYFKYSLQFLNSSLDTLVGNLRSKQKSGKSFKELFPNLFNNFQSEWRYLSLEIFELFSRKYYGEEPANFITALMLTKWCSEFLPREDTPL